jgi:hydrogenase expression/formation protein HypC
MCLAVTAELISCNGHPDPLWRSGEVCLGGVVRSVSLACVPDARIGDRLLVHVGLALTVVEPELEPEP